MHEFKHIKDKSKNSVTIRIRVCMYVEIVLNKFMYIGAGANEVCLYASKYHDIKQLSAYLVAMI